MSNINQLVSLAMRQLDGYSCDSPICLEKVVSTFNDWNDKDVGKVIISLGNKRVYLHGKKPGGFNDMRLQARLKWYLQLFNEVLHVNPGLCTTVAVSLWDEVTPEVAPLFGYQKNRQHKGLLLPDVDLLANRSFGRGFYDDETAYDKKANRAVFIGSTTGGGLITSDILEAPPPRIRSALFFKGNEKVIFELPIIAQCDSLETETLIRSLGLGDEIRSWEWQFQNRFILSMDGNGATCSRVAIALKSNSVLCKYDSPQELYYFPLLVPWVHYIPVTEDADVEAILRMESQRPGRFRGVAKNGSEFFRQYLSRNTVVQYTETLLSEYAKTFPRLNRESFQDQELLCYNTECAFLETVPTHDMTGNDDEKDQVLEHSIGHISNFGDYVGENPSVIGLENSGNSLEGISLTLRDHFKNDFKYRVQFSDGSTSDWVSSGEYAGTRLQSRPITNVEINASEYFQKIFEVSLELKTISGGMTMHSSGESSEDQHLSNGKIPLEQVTVRISRRKHQGDREHHNQLHEKLKGISDPTLRLTQIHNSLHLLHENFHGEIDEQRLFSEFIKPEMKVLEIGANVGRSTLVIASLLDNPENLVSFECDPVSYHRLTDNRDCNGLTCHCVNAAISERKLIQAGWSTIPSDTVHLGFTEVPTMTLAGVLEKFPIAFDTLVLDCEGAFYHILRDTPEIMDGITTVIIENDFAELSQKEFVDDVFRRRGLRVVIQRPGPWGPCVDRFYEVWKK